MKGNKIYEFLYPRKYWTSKLDLNGSPRAIISKIVGSCFQVSNYRTGNVYPSTGNLEGVDPCPAHPLLDLVVRKP